MLTILFYNQIGFTDRAQTADITALGAAMAAGQAKGIEVWPLDLECRDTIPNEVFLPDTTPAGNNKNKSLINVFEINFIKLNF